MEIEYGDDRRIHKRVLKSQLAAFAADKGFTPSLGSSVPDAKAFDHLLSIAESIETSAQLVENQLNRQNIDSLSTHLTQTDIAIPPGVAKFYTTVQQGLNALKKTNFTRLPRSDIADLESYVERLTAFDFEAQFAILQAKFAIQPLNPMVQANLEREFQEAEARAAHFQTALDTEMDNWQIVKDDAARAGNYVAQGDMDEHRLNVEEFEKEIKISTEQARVAAETLSKGNVTRGKIGSRRAHTRNDMALVLPKFNQFIASLKAGIQAYNSGQSGKNTLVGGATHLMMGGAAYLPRRFM